MSVITQRLLLFFMVIACIPIHAQLPCCQVQPAPENPFGPAFMPLSVAFSPISNCLAVANSSPSSVSVFIVNPDCSLTSAPGSPFDAGTFPSSVAYSPSGNCLAVANQGSGNVSVFTVGDPTPCSLSLVGNFDTDGVAPFSVAFSPSGNCLAVANQVSNNISIFTVNPDTCSLSLVGTFDTGGELPFSVAFSPSGNCLAVANFNSNNISVFTVANPDNCTLNTPAAIYGIADGVGSNPYSVAFSPISNCLAVANFNSNTISIFTVNPDDCTLNTPAAIYGIEDSVGSNPTSVAFSPDGTCLAVANRSSNNISIFTVNPDTCSLSLVGTFDTGGAAPTSVAFSPISNCLAVANLGSNNVSVFSPFIVQQPTITSTMVTNCNIVTVTGTADPNATITLFVNDNPNTMGSTDDAGNFTIDTTPLPAGTYSITAVATVSGCTSAPSDVTIVTIGLPTITSVSLGCGNFVTVIGTSTPNSTVSITVDGLPIATGMTNSEGTFIFTGIILSSGMHCITATDTSSGCSSAPVCVDVTSLSCVLNAPNLAFGTHCNRS